MDLAVHRRTARFGVWSVGDAMSTVTVAWLAVLIAPPDYLGLYVGLAVAAYTCQASSERLRWRQCCATGRLDRWS